MKKIILLLTAAAFLMYAPLAIARDANLDETLKVMRERTAADKAAALKAKEQAATADADKDKPAAKKAKAKEKAN